MWQLAASWKAQKSCLEHFDKPPSVLRSAVLREDTKKPSHVPHLAQFQYLVLVNAAQIRKYIPWRLDVKLVHTGLNIGHVEQI